MMVIKIKKKSKKSLTISVLVLIFICLIMLNDYKKENLLENKKSIQINEKVNIKSADYWNLTGTPIKIDNDGGSSGFITWADATGQDWCSGDGTWGTPYVIENVTINGEGSGSCIEIKDSNVYFLIKNCSVSNSGVGAGVAGIKLYNVYNGSIVNNTCSYKNRFGIFLQNSNNNTVLGNTANNTIDGIHLLESYNNTISGNNASNNTGNGIYLYQSYNNTVSGNTANDNKDNGIFLWYSNNNTVSGNTANNTVDGIYLLESNNNTISGNEALNNTGNGIFLYQSNKNNILGNTANNNSDSGILLWYSLNNNVSGNYAYYNGKSGINFSTYSNYNNITENIVFNNTVYGIYLESSYNIIYLNNFTGNDVNAMDNGTNNQWDNRTIGNYWDDYDGVDANDDGFGDTPYNISGTAGSKDYFPIWDDSDDPPIITINTPKINVVLGKNAPSFDIVILHEQLHKMWYTIDGGLNNYTFTEFAGTINQTAWNALPDGTVIIRFYANDTTGNIGFQEVSVRKYISISNDDDDDDDKKGIKCPNREFLLLFLLIISLIGISGYLIYKYIPSRKRGEKPKRPVEIPEGLKQRTIEDYIEYLNRPRLFLIRKKELFTLREIVNNIPFDHLNTEELLQRKELEQYINYINENEKERLKREVSYFNGTLTINKNKKDKIIRKMYLLKGIVTGFILTLASIIIPLLFG